MRDVPVLLSVGYAACHWCHVMAHESFEDEATAAYLNEHFVSIKVDREERPDVDAVYMQATTAMTGHGGWPMTCVLDHDGNPFFAGTYFPDQPRHGQPSFRQVLEALVDAWRDPGRRREAGGRAAARAPAASRWPRPRRRSGRRRSTPRCSSWPGSTTPSAAASAARRSSRRRWCWSSCCGTARSRRRAMAAATLEAMARGGIHDQLGGGFARYSVDADWVVPHFEKMLYDNALLLRVYADWGTARRRVGGRGHRRLPARRAAHGRGRLRLRARRRQRGRRGHVLRLDARRSWPRCSGPDDGPWAAAGRWRSPRPARSSTAPRRCSCATTPRTWSAGSTCQRRLLAAREHPGAPGPRRQGGGRLERAGDQRPLRRRHPARPAGVRRRGGRCRRAAAPGCTSSTDGCAASPATASVGTPAGVLEDHGCVASGFLDLAAGDRRPGLAGARAGAARHRARPTSRPTTAASSTPPTTPRRWSPGPATPPTTPRPSGLSSMVHALVDVRRADRLGPLPRRRRGGAGHGRRRSPSGRRASRAGRSRPRSRCSTGRWRWRSSDRPAPERDALERRARRHAGAVVVVADGPVAGIPLLDGRAPRRRPPGGVRVPRLRLRASGDDP